MFVIAVMVKKVLVKKVMVKNDKNREDTSNVSRSHPSVAVGPQHKPIGSGRNWLEPGRKLSRII